MSNHENGMTPINPDTQNLLRKEWVPRLDRLREQRRPLRNVMIGIILAPLVLALAIVVRMVFFSDDRSWFEGSLIFGLISFSAVFFVYLGKLQACDDAIHEIICTVFLGYVEPLLRAIKKVTCYSQFRGIIDDVGKIFKQGIRP